MGSHIVTSARGDAPYIGVPVFPSRAFRHSAIYIRTDRRIRAAADLAGRTIGLPEYQQTAALWVRGILREHYGVDTRGIAWRTGGERVAITLPPGFDVKPLGQDLEAALMAGEIDALIGPRPPACFTQPLSTSTTRCRSAPALKTPPLNKSAVGNFCPPRLSLTRSAMASACRARK